VTILLKARGTPEGRGDVEGETERCRAHSMDQSTDNASRSGPTESPVVYWTLEQEQRPSITIVGSIRAPEVTGLAFDLEANLLVADDVALLS